MFVRYAAGVAVAVQGSLFEHHERRRLGAGAWLDVRAGWTGHADVLLAALPEAVPWRAERRRMYDRMLDVPRLVDRKSTRLNSSHVAISYAVFCLKKKK